MAEFKRLADVEAVAEPAETANVLIEENGIIKRAPKTAVGGGDEWDVIIHLEGGADMESVETFTLVKGSYQIIANKLAARALPKILITWHYCYGDYIDMAFQAHSAHWNGSIDDVNHISIDFMNGHNVWSIKLDENGLVGYF